MLEIKDAPVAVSGEVIISRGAGVKKVVAIDVRRLYNTSHEKGKVTAERAEAAPGDSRRVAARVSGGGREVVAGGGRVAVAAEELLCARGLRRVCEWGGPSRLRVMGSQR